MTGVQTCALPIFLHQKLRDNGRRLQDEAGAPLYGIKSGLDSVFVVTRSVRDSLIRADSTSTHLLKPYLEGRDLRRWRADSQDLWLIYIPRNAVDIDRFSAIKAHLEPHKVALEARATKQAWFELQQAQAAYAESFQSDCIMYADLSQHPKFCFVPGGAMPATTVFAFPSNDACLLAILNSKAIWYQVTLMCPSVRGATYRLKRQYLNEIVIPSYSDDSRGTVASLAQSCQSATESRGAMVKQFGHEILRDLALGGLTSKLPGVLQNWPLLDFAAFRSADRKSTRLNSSHPRLSRMPSSA